jgi:hypothetical protein
MGEQWTKIATADDITADVLAVIEMVHDGYYADEPRIDWYAFLDRVERTGMYDLGAQMDSPVVKAIKKIVKGLRQ